MKVNELSPRRRADVTVKVVSVSEPRDVTSKDGSSHRVADAVVADETGSIIMSLWDDNIDKVKEGMVVQVSDGFVNVFKGSMRLTLGREGKITESTTKIENPNTNNNMSDRQVEEPERRFGRGGGGFRGRRY